MNEDFQLIKQGLQTVEAKMTDTVTRDDIREAVLLLTSSMILLTEIVYKHVANPWHRTI